MTDVELDSLVDRILNHIAAGVNHYDDLKEIIYGARNRDDIKLIIRKHIENGSKI